MSDVDWGDDDDSFLLDSNWEQVEAQIIASRRQSKNNGAQLASNQPPAGQQGPPREPPAPVNKYQQPPPAPIPQQPYTGPQQQQMPPPPQPQWQQPQQQWGPPGPPANPPAHGKPPQQMTSRSLFFGPPRPPPAPAPAPPPQHQSTTGPPPAQGYQPQPSYSHQHQQYYQPPPQAPPGAAAAPLPHYQQLGPPPPQWCSNQPPQQQSHVPYGPPNGPLHPQQQQQHYGQPPAPQPQQQQPPLRPAQQPTAAMITLYATIALARSSGTLNSGASTSAAAAAAKKSGKPAPQMLEVQIGYHDATNAVLRLLGGGTWDSRRRIWIFPLSHHDKVVDALQATMGVKVAVTPLHALPVAVLRAASSIPDDSSRYCHIPTSLEQQLMEFQREGVQFGLQHGGRVLIGDEMGLGKTVQAIALAAAYRDEWPGLVITPSSLREQWADALHKWLGITDEKIFIVNNGKDAQNVPTRGLQFLIVSYNFLDKMDLEGKYEVVIVDESHYIKDGGAKRTKAALPILKHAKRCFLLTGTPALNRPKEIYTQLSALVPTAKIKMKDFGERYCAGNKFDRYGGAQNLDELHTMLRGSVMVRRLKQEVLSQLPKKRRQQVFLSLDAEARRQLAGLSKQLDSVKHVVAQLAAQNAASGGAVALGGGRMDENRAIMEMYRRTAELKSKAVQDYVEMLLDAGQKFLIFAHHKELMDAMEHTCNRRKGGCKFIRIDGSTPATDRSRLVNMFQDQDSVRVAILSIKAAGVGLTLTAASTVVFAEMTWTPGEIIQAEDRAHRIGQASAVNVYFLHVRSSVDEIIWAAIQNKLDNLGQALDGQNLGMDVMHARNMPERGQRAIDSFLTQGGPGHQQHHVPLRPLSPDCSSSPPKVMPASHAAGRVGGRENSEMPAGGGRDRLLGSKRPREGDW